MPKLRYPATPTVNQSDDFHGTLVGDPYRWLEEVDAPETRAWVQAQNELTYRYLEKIPARERLTKRLTALWNYAKAGAPFQRGGLYFQFRNTGLQNQDILYVADAPAAAGRSLLDPNRLSPDGTAALNAYSVSDDGRWLAYAISSSGSDWQEWRIRDVQSGLDLPETLTWSKFSGAAWAKDSSGFYYGRYPAPAAGETYQQANYNQQLVFHRLQTPQSEDSLVYARPDQPEWSFGAEISDDGRYLLLTVGQGTDSRNRFFYKDLQLNGEMLELIPNLEAAYSFVGNDGPLFYFQTDRNAPGGCLLSIDIRQPDPAHWQTLIAESEDVLESVHLFGEQFVAVYLHDARHILRRFGLDGAPLADIPLPGLGSLPALSGKRAQQEMFYTFSGYLAPASVYRYDFKSGQSELIFTPQLDFDFSAYETRQVFVPSKDGTKIPMFLTHKKGLVCDGQNPTLLYGYGGFNISYLPAFAVQYLAWLELGAVFAVANLRGGSEYGEEWHQAGMLHNKQNVFDDFIACAEWLIAEKVTCTPKLAIEGRSNGGLLVGACMTQRPDLYGACLPIVGVMDMLRFHKFTIGWAWVSDYGCADDPQFFPTLYAYSPYHNLRPGTVYPATLVLTGDHDDRVVPGHSFKFAAALQAAQAGDAPALIRIQTKAGHGMGKPTAILIQEWADIFAFLVQALAME
ncbi:MAG: prolyl oligopeptidase family serine peptidase [Anaerolineales bacterium]|jgi:prolyl oligopeptidase|nr:prolyl oligopeptidase family serine peptidase [Anaerolineales bacterium]